MSVAEANRKYFDAISDSYDDKPWWANANRKVSDYLRARLDWVGLSPANAESNDHEVRFLDYACGPGLMSRIYGPYVTITRGIDISPNMVATYNARARTGELPPSKINAAVGDLLSKTDPNPPAFSGPEYHDFDLAAVGFGFHHFEDVVYAARCLKERLRPGGVLIISDFLEGGDVKADEDGNMVSGSEADLVGAIHGHHPDPKVHQHHHRHHGHHHHGKGDEDKEDTGKYALRSEDDGKADVRQKMKASIVVPHFDIEGVKKFFAEAGFVDVEVDIMDEKVYMEFTTKMFRTVLFAKGRRPLEEEKSEL